MGRYFFTGGLMPARDTLLHFQNHLKLQCQWDLSGSHYQKTAEAWLNNMDKNSQEIIQLFTETYGKKQANLWLQRWRIFFMSCAELFGYSNGNEWLVAHYLFSKQR
jgi:cyclopropane-fatty-acyl-phospholipid synthase